MVAVPGASGPGGHHPSGAATAPARHPADPDPVVASKARAVWWLGLLALLTGPLLGGVVPATVALTLAGQFRHDAYPSGGFLAGAARARRGERMAWGGIVLAVAAAVMAATAGLFEFASTPPAPDFPPHVD
jgi:hypothetical protein